MRGRPAVSVRGAVSALRRHVAIVLAATTAIGAIVIAQDARSVWDGVYTEEQAKRGEELYFDRCGRCHGATYMGGTDGALPLVGSTFNGNWNGVKLDQMLDRVRLTM